MNTILESLVIVVLGGGALLGAFFVVETWFRVWEQRAPSPFFRTLYRAGADPQRLAQAGLAREMALAEQCCPTCAAIGACREWLESGSLETYRSFCPNAALVERLAARR
jgi:hypothetical protein